MRYEKCVIQCLEYILLWSCHYNWGNKKNNFTVLLTKFPFVYLNGLHFVIYAWWKIM